jgi:hypothetical protein
MARCRHSSFNTSVSFNTNTNWQLRRRIDHELSDAMLALTVRIPSPRRWHGGGDRADPRFRTQSMQTIGNFWVDRDPRHPHILLPLSSCSPWRSSQGVGRPFGTERLPLIEQLEYDNPKLDAGGQPLKDDRAIWSPRQRKETGGRRRPRHRRSQSNISAPTAAASSMPTQAHRWRTRRRCELCWMLAES